MASETLLAMGLVRNFAGALPGRDSIKALLGRQLQSLAAMCTAALCVRNVKRGVAAPQELSQRTAEYFALRNRTYPEQHPKPKLHYCLHLGPQAESDAMLLDCFTHERKHQDVKRFGTNIRGHTALFQQSVASHAIWQHVERLSQAKDAFLGGDRLEPPVKHVADLAIVFGAPTRTAKRSRLKHAAVVAGDVARLRDGSLIVVCAPVQIDGSPDVNLVVWRAARCRVVTASSAVYRKELIDVVAGHEVTHTCVWSPVDDDFFLALAPL